MATALVTVPAVIFKPPPRKVSPFLSQFKSNPQFSFSQIKTPNPIKFSPKSTLKPVTDQAPTTVLRENIAGNLETLKKPASFVILLGFLSTSDPCSAIAASGGRSSLNSYRQLYFYSYPRHIASGVLLCVGIVAAIVLWRTWILKMMSWIVSATQNSVSSSSSPVPSSSVSMVEAGLISAGTVAVIFICYWIKNRSDRAQRSTVLKLQVGLLDMGRSLQKVLNRIAKTVSKPSSEELSYVLTETLLALLRHPDCCISSYSSVDVKQSIEDGENLFNQHTIVERGKFDKETLVNVNGIKHRRASTQRFNNFWLSGNRYIVVTILVAVKGEHNLPVINKIDDLKSAIHTLGSLPANKTLVGLLGMARSLQKDLDKIAETADTSSPEGLSHILTETSLALLRYPDCYISTFSSVDFEQDIEDGETHFNQLSIEERGKLDEETLVNVDNIKNQSTSRQKFESFSNEYIVVTIIVAAKGEHKLPVISSSVDLMEALHTLILLPTKKILAVEVLWTPQNENDTLSEQELLEKYPLLKSL